MECFTVLTWKKKKKNFGKELFYGFAIRCSTDPESDYRTGDDSITFQ